MTLARSRSSALVAVAFVVGCSSSSDAGDGDGGTAPYACPPGGAVMSEADACAELRGALADRAASLACAVTLAACPGFLRDLTTDGTCRDWSHGSIDACASYVTNYASCDDFAGKPFLPAFQPTATGCGDAGP